MADDGTTEGLSDPRSTTGTVTVAVSEVNDAPTFTKGSDQTVNSNSGAQVVPGWATKISPGPSNESGQSLTFLVSSDKSSLFLVQPSVDPSTGELTYTPAPDALGLANVGVRLMDDGGTAFGGVDESSLQTFKIKVTAPLKMVIDFEGRPEGDIVFVVSNGSGITGVKGDFVPGEVSVVGISADPEISTNAAIIFDAKCVDGCSGGDDDLNEPELGNVLIIAEDLVDADNNGFVDDPDDSALGGSFFEFNFSAWGTGTATVVCIDVLDSEEGGGSITLLRGGEELKSVLIPKTTKRLQVVPIKVPGVDLMRVTLAGSGAIDNIRLGFSGDC